MHRAFLKILKPFAGYDFLKKDATRKLQVTYGSDTCRDMASYAAMLDHRSPSLHALTTSSPVSSSFTLSSYHLTNISKFMRFYLISLACTSKPTPPFPFSQLLLTSSAHQVALYVLATTTLRAFPSLFSLFLAVFLFPFSILYSFSPLAHFNCIYTYIRIFFLLTEGNLNFVSHAFKELERALDKFPSS